MNTRRPRAGLSLLEVVLALAIFGMSLAALGELIRIGARCARESRELTTAQLYAESIMAEVATGIRNAASVPEGTELEIDPQWVYSVSVEPAEQSGLVSVLVTVGPRADRTRRSEFNLRQWIKDPGLELSSEEEPGEMLPGSTPGSTPTSNSGSPAGGASG